MPYSSICISSGHGLYVRGASGSPVPPQLDEVDEARRMVDRVAEMLAERGVDVKKFHDNSSRDQGTNLNTIVNWHNAQDREIDCSIHFNAFDGNAHGTEVLWVTQEALASEMATAIAGAGGFTLRGEDGAVYRTDLKFLNSTEMPAVLLEVCFCDNTGDSNLYREHFEDICCAVADVLGGEADDEEERPDRPARPERPPPVEVEALFYAKGKCSHFGGALDTGVSPSESLAFHFELTEANQHLFVPFQPAGTTGLARRLNAKAVHYVACRWVYEDTPKTMLAGDTKALVTSVATGASAFAFCADWGPNEATGRVCDLSPALMESLGLVTDDLVEVIYPAPED